MNYEQTIIARLEAGTLTRKEWTGVDAEGRELACLLAAIAPECGENKDAGCCPASVMPQWLAHLTPWIDDAGSDEAWNGHVRRFAATASKWGRLTEQHEYQIRALIVREAMRHTTSKDVIAACNRVLTLCERVARGECRDSLRVELQTASAAAREEAATWATAREEAATWATAEAEVAMAWAAEVAMAAAWAAAEAAEAAVRAAAEAEAEVAMAAAMAADRIIDQILEVLEAA